MENKHLIDHYSFKIHFHNIHHSYADKTVLMFLDYLWVVALFHVIILLPL